MKEKKYSSLGLEVPFQVPETVEEFDANAKRVGACLDEATNNCIYRGSLADFRSLFLYGQKADPEQQIEGVDGLDKITRYENPFVPAMTKQGQPLLKADKTPILKREMTEQEFFDHIIAQSGKDKSHFQARANEIAAMIEFDASATERTGPKTVKLGQNWLNSAEKLIAKGDYSNFEKNYHKFTGKDLVMPEFGEDKEKNKNLLGRLIKEMFDAKERQELESAKLL